ncbi:homoserine kinase [Allocatelliglobosispora scoriae]|uniref:Homoserine kinase n=1 Tax=Allocatelliglobosispora scoriae TaxID=643052 RepID=A0A841BYY8_9ACTN|nr:homoserine kinase [Allocatelliglobosispora scoriae]MBB5872022.1 homoserine kinase [Allocatelliglobosispora scoriae]
MTISLKDGPVTVRSPATSANLGPGFDSLGLALGFHDEVTAQLLDGATVVDVTGEGAGELATDESHLIVTAMRATFAELDVKAPGIQLACRNRIPQARGMGSSSAAIVAGVKLANALAGAPLDVADELVIAGRLEGHPDNVAPCLLGGFTIAWLDGEHLSHAVSRTVADGVVATVLVPGERGLTSVARAALPASVPHADASFNAARAALLVHAITEAPELLLTATEDRLHQNYRAPGMPATAALVAALRDLGVAAVVSGAGPSVLALSPIPANYETPAGWLRHNLTVDCSGAAIIE